MGVGMGRLRPGASSCLSNTWVTIGVLSTEVPCQCTGAAVGRVVACTVSSRELWACCLACSPSSLRPLEKPGHIPRDFWATPREVTLID